MRVAHLQGKSATTGCNKRTLSLSLRHTPCPCCRHRELLDINGRTWSSVLCKASDDRGQDTNIDRTLETLETLLGDMLTESSTGVEENTRITHPEKKEPAARPVQRGSPPVSVQRMRIKKRPSEDEIPLEYRRHWERPAIAEMVIEGKRARWGGEGRGDYLPPLDWDIWWYEIQFFSFIHINSSYHHLFFLL